MTETCRTLRDTIALEGLMPDDEALRAHLETCDDCTQFLERARAVELELDALGPEDVSDDVVETLLARPELTRPVRPRRSMQWALGLAAAAVLGFVALNITLTGHKEMRAPMTLNTGPGGGGGGGQTPKKEDNAELQATDELKSLGYLSGEAEAPEEDLSSVRRKFVQEFRENEVAEAIPEAVGEDERLAEKSKRTQGVVTVTGESPLIAPLEDVAVDFGVAGSVASPAPADTSAEEGFARSDADDALKGVLGGRASAVAPEKRVHVDPVYPAAGKDQNAIGVVVLRVAVDAAGNVTNAVVVRSVASLDDAAKEAVLQWKYVSSDQPVRTFEVEVTFGSEEPDGESAAFDRSRVDGLSFREAKGYWSNTYQPGDPAVRALKARLESAGFAVAPHAKARPVDQPFDAPARGALSVSMQADRRAIGGPSRVLVQVGVTGAAVRGRRRPPMNIGVVLDVENEAPASVRALIEALEQSKQMGDRFRLIIPGQGEVVAPESFHHGPVRVALDEAASSGDVSAALANALRWVHAGDDPTMPLGTSLVILVTPKKLGHELERLSQLAHRSAVGGVPVSVVGVGDAVDRDELDRLAMAGQARRYLLDNANDAAGIVSRELSAGSRVVARALRLRIKLAPGVRLVDVIGSHPLSERQTTQVKQAEKSIDLRLSRNLGIEADRGDDEDGIQILIPSFYAGDSHTILLDVVVDAPGPLGDVTAKYKDLTLLRNTEARASTSLAALSARNVYGPLETNVSENFLAHRLAERLERTSDSLRRGDSQGAVIVLEQAVAHFRARGRHHDIEMTRDLAMLRSYIQLVTAASEPSLLSYLADSLRFAAATKLSPSAST